MGFQTTRLFTKTTKWSHHKHHQGSFTKNNEAKKCSWIHSTYNGRKCMHWVCHHGEKKDIHFGVGSVLLLQCTLKGCAKPEHPDLLHHKPRPFTSLQAALLWCIKASPKTFHGVSLGDPADAVSHWGIQMSLTSGTDFVLI